jgi:hypothetical protein
VKEALESLAQGGYPEAVARTFALLARSGEPLPLAQLHLKRELAEKFAHLIPKTSREEQRRIRGEQEIIVRYEPERALETLPQLLRRSADRKRLTALLDAVLTDENLKQVNFKLTPQQTATYEKIRKMLSAQPATAASRGRTPAKRWKTPQRAEGGKRYGIPHERHV